MLLKPELYSLKIKIKTTFILTPNNDSGMMGGSDKNWKDLMLVSGAIVKQNLTWPGF